MYVLIKRKKMQTGELNLVAIVEESEFASLMYACATDNDSSVSHTSTVFDNYFKNRQMFGIKVVEGESTKHLVTSNILPCNSYLLPCFVVFVSDTNTIEYIWVHSRVRRNNLGTFMVKHLKREPAKKLLLADVIKDAKPFWRRVGKLKLYSTNVWKMTVHELILN